MHIIHFLGKHLFLLKAGGKPKGTVDQKGMRVCLTGDDSLTVAAPAPYSIGLARVSGALSLYFYLGAVAYLLFF